jgi:hypothetical protein
MSSFQRSSMPNTTTYSTSSPTVNGSDIMASRSNQGSSSQQQQQQQQPQQTGDALGKALASVSVALHFVSYFATRWLCGWILFQVCLLFFWQFDSFFKSICSIIQTWDCSAEFCVFPVVGFPIRQKKKKN